MVGIWIFSGAQPQPQQVLLDLAKRSQKAFWALTEYGRSMGEAGESGDISGEMGTSMVSTLWLCQNGYGKWPFNLKWIFPVKVVVFHSYLKLPEGKPNTDPNRSCWCQHRFDGISTYVVYWITIRTSKIQVVFSSQHNPDLTKEDGVKQQTWWVSQQRVGFNEQIWTCAPI